MIHRLLQLAKEVSSLNEQELNEEIEKTKYEMKVEEEATGRANFDTTLKAHMLMIPLVFNLKDENKNKTQKD
jgi:hypothetical protein